MATMQVLTGRTYKKEIRNSQKLRHLDDFALYLAVLSGEVGTGSGRKDCDTSMKNSNKRYANEIL